MPPPRPPLHNIVSDNKQQRGDKNIPEAAAAKSTTTATSAEVVARAAKPIATTKPTSPTSAEAPATATSEPTAVAAAESSAEAATTSSVSSSCCKCRYGWLGLGPTTQPATQTTWLPSSHRAATFNIDQDSFAHDLEPVGILVCS